MAMLDFDARTVEPQAKPDPIPAGMYEAVIIDSEWKATKAGTGKYLNLTFEIAEHHHPYGRRKVWARLNLENRSDEAVGIARAQLSAICRAVNVLTPKDSSELHNRPLLVKVVLKPDDSGGLQNEIKGFEPRKQAPPAAPVVPYGSPQPAAPAAPPWKR